MAPSSPVALPGSPAANTKRQREDNVEPPAPKQRVFGGFVADDESDDDDDDDDVVHPPSPKRRMFEFDSQHAQKPIENLRLAQENIATPPDSERNPESDEEAERYERLFGSQNLTTSTLPSTSDILDNSAPYRLRTCAGRSIPIRERKPTATVSYATMVAARSKTKEGRAHKEYFGIDIHELMDAANKEIADARKAPVAVPFSPPAHPDAPVPSVEVPHSTNKKQKRSMLWTEKYRAKNFMDLVGDDMTNRQVLRWLKRWDQIVFPHATKGKPNRRGQQNQQQEEEKPHRKILMLTGPPGLGKTTLAHVCARQAGYEVMEINASDDRSKDVVKGRIRTSLGTETVKTVENKKSKPGKQPKVARPVCVVVDEVDGVVGGSGASGEGGFVRALIDLVLLDQKNSATTGTTSGASRKKKKGDDFRQMRPLVLICNDVYHPSLRPLRQSGLAEIIHVGKPSVEAVVTRLKTVFEKEGIPCEKDAARKICEAAWGMTGGLDARKGLESNAEGDLRGVMVVGEWVAGRLKATAEGPGAPTLTRGWVDKHILQSLGHGGGGARGLGRGSIKEIVTRLFQEGAGFPKQTMAPSMVKKTKHELPQTELGFMEQGKKYAMGRLAEMIETSGDIDRIMTEVLSEYPNREFNDDCFLTKPNLAYEWMHFHDICTARVFGSQEWELAPYASQPILACHHLFASPRRHQPQPTGYDRKWGDAGEVVQPLPFTGPGANYAAFEATKVNRATLQTIREKLPPCLGRAFRSPEAIARDFLPFLSRLLSPDIKPVVVGGGNDKFGSVASVRRESEKAMVRRSAAVLAEVGIELLKGRIESDPAAGPAARTQWVYRLEP